jgi:hypothetical protein
MANEQKGYTFKMKKYIDTRASYLQTHRGCLWGGQTKRCGIAGFYKFKIIH